MLFLRVRAAADFFTTNKELMSSPPPVDVDLILDPYVSNVFPRSLGPRMQSSQPQKSNQILPVQRIRPQHPFYLLPAELILDIIDMLPPEAFINFAFANYPFLQASGLAPALSRVRIEYIQARTQIPALFPLLKIPAEITLEIMHHLKPMDMMRFVLANYQDLARQGITPPLTQDTLWQLRSAVGLRHGSQQR